MRREYIKVHSPSIGIEGEMLVYGHHGRPVLVFPSQQGNCWDYEERGMVTSVQSLIDEGRAKLYCVGSHDTQSWYRDDISLEDRAIEHGKYEDWIVHQIVPWIVNDCEGRSDLIATGCSFGAYHAANFALRRADIFDVAICQSGVYDVSVVGSGPRGDALYFHNPVDYVSNAHGDHLEWLQNSVHLVLVCGQGQWEDTTGALESTTAFGGILASKGISHEVDLWGHDVPHDWPSWRAQIAHQLPRFC